MRQTCKKYYTECQKLKAFPLKSGKGQESTITTLIQYSVFILSQNNYSSERNKRDTNRERSSKFSQFAHEIILFLKDPRKSTRVFLGLEYILSNVTEQEISLKIFLF
jgi:hypothetical protein